MLPVLYGTLALGGLWTLWSLELSVSGDAGTWSPEALPGEVVHALVDSPRGLLAGTESGLYALRPDGSARRVPGIPGPVYALAASGEQIRAGTGDGVYALLSSGAPEPRGLEGVPVRDLAVSGGRTYAATEEGLYEEVKEWTRVWPAGEPRPVNAVLGSEGGMLFGTEQGIFRLGSGGEIESLRDRGAVVHLARTGADEIWAGLRGGERLLRSQDGDSWGETGGEVRLQSVEALVEDPEEQDRLYIGGSGLADGDGTAGVMVSEDGGRSWRTEQNRLSNTPVLSLAVRRERLEIEVSLPPLVEARSVALPASGSRFYAGTNGSGVYTHRPPGPVFSFFESLGAGARFAEPALFGLLLLAVAWRLYHGRRYPGRERAKRRTEQGRHPRSGERKLL